MCIYLFFLLYFKKNDALENIEGNIPEPAVPNDQYDSSHTLIYTISSLSNANIFCNTYNHANGYNGLKVGQRIQINDGLYNRTWYIAGFDCEYNGKTANNISFNNGYGICLIPTETVTAGIWNNSYSVEYEFGYINSTIHTSTLSTVASNLQNVLGSHLINRTVYLSSRNSGVMASIETKTTAYCTLMSEVQVLGFYYDPNSADIGEANYLLPLFYYTGNWLSSSYWLRSFGIGHGSDQLMGHIIDYEGKLESAVSTKYNGVRPMIYIR